jgi:hypothetical protein
MHRNTNLWNNICAKLIKKVGGEIHGTTNIFFDKKKLIFNGFFLPSPCCAKILICCNCGEGWGRIGSSPKQQKQHQFIWQYTFQSVHTPIQTKFTPQILGK